MTDQEAAQRAHGGLYRLDSGCLFRTNRHERRVPEWMPDQFERWPGVPPADQYRRARDRYDHLVELQRREALARAQGPGARLILHNTVFFLGDDGLFHVLMELPPEPVAE